MITPEKRAEISQWVDDVNQALNFPPAEDGYEEKRKGAVVHENKPKGKKNGHERAFRERKAARDILNIAGGRGMEHAAIDQFEAENDEDDDSETELGDVIESSHQRMQRQILGDVKKGWATLAAN